MCHIFIVSKFEENYINRFKRTDDYNQGIFFYIKDIKTNEIADRFPVCGEKTYVEILVENYESQSSDLYNIECTRVK